MSDEEDKLKKSLGILALQDDGIIDDLGRQVDSRAPNSQYVMQKAKENEALRKLSKGADQASFAEQRQALSTQAPVVMDEARMEFDKKTLEGGRQNISDITGVETRPQADPREIQQQKTGAERIDDIEYERARKDILRRKGLGQPLYNPNRDTPEYKKAVRRFAEEQQSLIDSSKVANAASNLDNVVPISGVKKAATQVAKGGLKALGAIAAPIGILSSLASGDAAAALPLGGAESLGRGSDMDLPRQSDEEIATIKSAGEKRTQEINEAKRNALRKLMGPLG